MESFAAFLAAGVLAGERLVRRNLTGNAVREEEARGAAGVSPQTAIKHLLWDGATPADSTPLGATVVRVFGAELSDIGPVEAFGGRRRTEGAAGSSPTRRAAGDARARRSHLVNRTQWKRRSKVRRNQWQSQVGFTCKTKRQINIFITVSLQSV